MFFIHSIDPISWILLMLFVRPFYQIVCFRYRFVKEIGFKRLRVDTISYHEFIDCQKKAVSFAKENNFAEFYKNNIRFGNKKINLTNQFAKEATYYIADILMSAKILSKSSHIGGFILNTGIVRDVRIQKKIIPHFQTQTGLNHKQAHLFKLLYNFFMLIIIITIQIVKLFTIVKKPTSNKHQNIKNRIIYYDLSPSEMNLNPIKHLSATVFIDNDKLKKEDIIFLSKNKEKNMIWRQRNYTVYKSLKDLLNFKLMLKVAIISLRTILINITFIVRNFHFYKTLLKITNLIIADILTNYYELEGMVFSISSIGSGPIESLPLLTKSKPVVLYCYSSSNNLLPYFCYLNCSHFFVWNKATLELMKILPQTIDIKYTITGPFMMGIDSIKNKKIIEKKDHYLHNIEGKQFKIGIFDIAPASFLEDIRVPPVFTKEMHKEFMFDIFKLSMNLNEIRLLIKPKRWTHRHDVDEEVKRYIRSNNNTVELLPQFINPYLAIQMCDYVICMPYTSILLAAYQKGIPGIYYTPLNFDEYYPKNPILSHLLIKGYEDLKKEIICAMNGKHISSKMDLKEYQYLTGLKLNESVRDNFIGSLSSVFKND